MRKVRGASGRNLLRSEYASELASGIRRGVYIDEDLPGGDLGMQLIECHGGSELTLHEVRVDEHPIDRTGRSHANRRSVIERGDHGPSCPVVQMNELDAGDVVEGQDVVDVLEPFGRS